VNERFKYQGDQTHLNSATGAKRSGINEFNP